MAEIRSYPITLKQVGKLKVTAALRLNEEDSTDEVGMNIKPHVWRKNVKLYDGKPLLIRSDGGFIGGIGTIGFVVYDICGSELARGYAYDKGESSN